MAARVLIPLLGIVVLVAPAVGSAARCPGGRFALERTHGTDEQAVLGPMVIELRSVSLGPCGATRFDARRAGRGMVLRAGWQACDALAGRVQLRARIDRTCSRMTGVVRLRGRSIRFRATRTPLCGNGIREGDEACDEASPCCTIVCTRIADPVCTPPSCTTDADCGDGAFCTHATACGGPGTCSVRPDACLPVVEPMCGCDGRTHANACEAARAGVDVLRKGSCGRVCGTDAHLGCPDGSFCEFPPDSCRVADRAGTCAPIPDGCLASLDPVPVCGCDGTRYGNDCERQRAAASRARCPCDPPGCSNVPCTTDGDCLPHELCVTPVGACGGSGSCFRRPEGCLALYQPVCGCDGRTYPSVCDALSQRANVRARQRCR